MLLPKGKNINEALDGLNVFGTWSLGTLAFGEFYRLAFVQIIEIAFYGRTMEKEICSALGSDEAEASV